MPLRQSCLQDQRWRFLLLQCVVVAPIVVKGLKADPRVELRGRTTGLILGFLGGARNGIAASNRTLAYSRPVVGGTKLHLRGRLHTFHLGVSLCGGA